MSDLTILCITKGQSHAEPFIARMAANAEILDARFHLCVDSTWAPRVDADRVTFVQSRGHLESVLDLALDGCPDGYVLRLDDDEHISPGMFGWLADRAYEGSDHWAFPRWNLWPDADHYIENKPLWPDWQTRLSVKAKSGGRLGVHDGSPFGTGKIAPVALEHHKFLIRSREEREALVEHYESLRPGAGEKFVMFSVPERYEDVLSIKRVEQPVRA